jgi:hypothetical protein
MDTEAEKMGDFAEMTAAAAVGASRGFLDGDPDRASIQLSIANPIATGPPYAR